MESTLDRLEQGERGTVLRIELPPARAEALTRLGLLPGTAVACLRRSPLGDPTAYRWRETTVALRRRDAAEILVKRDQTNSDLSG